jgi:hypothetical protein
VFKRITMLITAALLVATMAVATAGTASAAPKCPNGTTSEPTGEPGQFECVTIEQSKKNPKFAKEETTTSTGAPNANKEGTDRQTTTEDCAESNPGNSCPGGQFKDQ